MTRALEFRKRLLARDPLLGVWVKTPSHIVAEVLGLTSLDCICLDAEHAPFDRGSIDAAVLALRGADMPSLVRVQSATAENLLSALDCGATGVVAPHVRTQGDAENLARACRYGAGGRGYAGSSRAAMYTTRPMAEHLRRSNAETAVIAQIEDIESLRDIDLIAAVDGIDCLFVGRIDLTVALGAATPNEAAVIEAVREICAAGVRHRRPVGMFLSNLAEIPQWRQAGASLFMLKSDHTFMLEGAQSLRKEFDRASANRTE